MIEAQWSKTPSSDGVPWVSPIMQPDRAPWPLLAFALLLGLLLALLAPMTEQEGIDGALVLAGIVHYPPHSPMSEYFLGSWTIIHQLGALLLRAGVHQAHVSEVLFVIPCMLLVGAYAAIIYCFSGQFLFSLLAAALCYLANPLAKFFASPDYMLVGLPWSQPPIQTFGFWAHAGSVWVIGCIAAGRKALAAFSALVLIAVHPVLGAYMTALLVGAVLISTLILERKLDGFAKGVAKGAGWGVTLGTAITVLSFAFYLKTRPDLSGGIDQAAYDAYMSAWDTHRSHMMTPDIAARIAIVAAIAVGILSVFLIFARPRRDTAFLTAVLLMLAVIVSTAAYFTMHLAPDLLPELVMRAAPGRLLNIQAFISTPLAIGLAACAAGQAAREWTTPATAWICRAIPVVALALIVVEFGSAVLSRRQIMIDDARLMFAPKALENGSAPAGDAAFWRNVATTGISDPVLTSRAASRPALYSGHLPVALNVGSFDFIPYIPQTAGAVAKIIQQGYGISFFDPPPEVRQGGALPFDGGRAYWAGLGPDDWCRLSKSLGIGALVAPHDWTIKLPRLLTGPRFALYRIACG